MGSLGCVAEMRFRDGGERAARERPRLYGSVTLTSQALGAANVTRLSPIEPLEVKNAKPMARGFTNERESRSGIVCGENVEADPCGARSDHPQLPRGRVGDVDHATLPPRSAVVDPNHHRSPVLQVRDADSSAEGQRSMRGRQLVHVEAL